MKPRTQPPAHPPPPDSGDSTPAADERRREAAITAEALQAAIFSSAAYSSIATDARGVIQIFNAGAERMLGYEAAEVVDRLTPADLSDPHELVVRARALSAEFARPIAPGFQALAFKASRGLEDNDELTYVRKDGSRFPATVSVTALRDPGGAIIGYLLVGTDNTARQHVEAERQKLDQSLRDQHFYTRSLIESNVDALVTTNPQGIITDVNRQMELLTGSTRDELIGALFKDSFTDPDAAAAAITKVLKERKVTDFDLTSRNRNGTETAVSFNLTTFYDRQRTLQGVFAAARDVTERRRLDAALREKNTELQAARVTADKANLAKSDFLSSMSHELRSPLNAILGFAQLMESESPEPTPAQHDSIGQILQAGWHLLTLIDEILDLAKIESGRFSLSLEPVSLGEVLGECQGIIEGQARERAIRLKFPTFTAPCWVHADKTRLKQVLINLLSNAIKYNRPGGSVEVTYALGPPGTARVGVIDTGAGLSPDRLAQLFQPFNRLGQEGGGVEGTGIGLVMAKRLVEVMHGVIGVTSAVDVGSEFWVELPAGATPDSGPDHELAPTPPLDNRTAPGRTRHVLYVEDNIANLKLVERLLARRPEFRLTSAATGREGVALARKLLPEVILMDINLPDISGIEALRLIRRDPATAHIPVVAVSANAMPDGIERGLEAGFLHYVTKPIKVKSFMAALEAALLVAEEGKPPAPASRPTE